VNIDHFVPISHGGLDNTENMWPLCPSCHGKKTISERMKGGGGRYCLICARFSSHTTCFDELKEKMTMHCNDMNNLTAIMDTARIAVAVVSVNTEITTVHRNHPRTRGERPNRRRRDGDVNRAVSVYKRLHAESLLNYHARIGEKIRWTGKRKTTARAMSTERHNKVYGCATAGEYMLNATKGDYIWDLKNGYITVPRLDAAIGLCDLNRTRADALQTIA
jgi:hypothetical protein